MVQERHFEYRSAGYAHAFVRVAGDNSGKNEVSNYCPVLLLSSAYSKRQFFKEMMNNTPRRMYCTRAFGNTQLHNLVVVS